VIRKFILILAVISMAGCLPRNAFAPPPDNWEMWKKPGADQVTLSKDLLNCGYRTPFSGTGIEVDASRTLSQSAGSMICMERLGYIYSPGGRDKHSPRGGAKPICSMSGWKSTDACRLGRDIPTPDPQRRLSGGYCKKYPAARACTP